jgi:signal transduction histidine kinase
VNRAETATQPRWWSAAGALARAAVLAVLLLPTSWTALDDSGIGAGWTWVLRVALVALHVVVLPPLVTQRPAIAFAIGSVAMLVLVLGPDLGGPMAAQAGAPFAPILLPSSLVWFVLLYEVAARAPAPWPSAALGVGGVGSVVTVVRLWDATEYAVPLSGEWGWRSFITAAVAGGTIAAWALGRYRAARVAWHALLADRSVADERRRIAREMHDVVAHSLAVVVAQAEAGRLAAANQPDRAPEVFGTIASTGREALQQMRGLLGVLRDDAPVIEHVTEHATGRAIAQESARRHPVRSRTTEPPAPTLTDLPGLLDQVRAAGVAVALTEHGTPRRLSPAAQLTAYRVVQESLTNVIRHAGAGADASVELDWSDGLHVTVTNTGGEPSARPDDTAPDHRTSGGRGLLGMRERLSAVGGELIDAGSLEPVEASDSRPSGHRDVPGWRIHARITP